MFGQSAPRMVISLVTGAAIVALLGAGVIFLTTDPLASSGDGQGDVEIPVVPDMQSPPEQGTEAFTRPMFSRDRAPGPDGPPAAASSDGASGDTVNAGKASGFTLKGVIIGERGARAALQSDKATEPTWVGSGQTVDGWKVESINSQRVRLRNGDEVVELKTQGTSQ